MWMLIGILVGLAIWGVIQFSKNRGINLTWYDWIIGIIGFGLILFTLQNSIGAFAEAEAKAAYLFLLVTGLPGLIFLAVAWQLSSRRAKKA
ncbi:MAG: dehalogenase [Dehalococcoides mccartyi]|uniref:dehalogenase n=1 Tax=Dehalococcoides mccartyi TaxID=61435 RepID=UPI000805FBB7|nr:dehalogenase [Dehalococcoides mccartyi]OBW62537.1 MAG: dehalogenase [Dehalococcoides mccartyi]